MTEAHAAYSVKDWDRRPWHSKVAAEATEMKLFRIEMIHVYTGAIQGEGTIQYLFANNSSRGGFVALEMVTGSVDGRSGSFVFQRSGTFGDGKSKMTLVVLPGSGTGELCGLSGHATLEVDAHLESYPITLEYEL